MLQLTIKEHLDKIGNKHSIEEAFRCGEIELNNVGQIIIPTSTSTKVAYLLHDREKYAKMVEMCKPYTNVESVMQILYVFASTSSVEEIYYVDDIFASLSKFLWNRFEVPMGAYAFASAVHDKFSDVDILEMCKWVEKNHYPTARKYIDSSFLQYYKSKR